MMMMSMLVRKYPLVCVVLVALLLCNVSVEGFFGGGRGGGGRRRAQEEEVEEVDLYEVLGLDEETTEKEIKKAYRTLSMKFHPDKNPGDDTAADKFREVSSAYEILSNEEKKFLYDQGGMSLVKEAENNEGRGGGMDMFGGFFGGQNRGNRGPDYQMRMRVSLEDLYNGAEKETRISRRTVCRGCGKPNLSEKAKARCASCGRCPNEYRMVHRQMGGFIVQQQEEVPSKEKCKTEAKTLTAVIERGMEDGTQIRFKYMSEQKPKQIPGDVVLILSQSRHPRFERRGNHLHYTMKISLKEALTGFSKTITHLDGHEVEIDREDEITRPFETVVIKEEGMPVHEVPSQFGDLHVTFDVQFPQSLTKEQIEQLKQLL